MLIRLAERNISQGDILKVILEGEIIEEYLLDKPFSSCLIFKMLNDVPLHVVTSYDEKYQKAYNCSFCLVFVLADCLCNMGAES